MELTDFRERLGSVSVQGVQLQKLLVQLALVSFDQVRRLFPFRSELVDIFYFNMDGVPSRQENGNKLSQDGKSIPVHCKLIKTCFCFFMQIRL